MESDLNNLGSFAFIKTIAEGNLLKDGAGDREYKVAMNYIKYLKRSDLIKLEKWLVQRLEENDDKETEKELLDAYFSIENPVTNKHVEFIKNALKSGRGDLTSTFDDIFAPVENTYKYIRIADAVDWMSIIDLSSEGEKAAFERTKLGLRNFEYDLVDGGAPLILSKKAVNDNYNSFSVEIRLTVFLLKILMKKYLLK